MKNKTTILSLKKDERAKSFLQLASAQSIDHEKEKAKVISMKQSDYIETKDLYIDIDKGQRWLFAKDRKKNLESIIKNFDMRQVKRVRTGKIKGKTELYVYDGQGTAFVMACLGFDKVPVEQCVFEDEETMRSFFLSQQDGVKSLSEWDMYHVQKASALAAKQDGQERTSKQKKALDVDTIVQFLLEEGIAFPSSSPEEEQPNMKRIPFGIIRRAINAKNIFYGNHTINNGKIKHGTQEYLDNDVLLGVAANIHKHFPDDPAFNEKLVRLSCAWVSAYGMHLENLKQLVIDGKTKHEFVHKHTIDFEQRKKDALQRLDFYIMCTKPSLKKQKQTSLYDHIFTGLKHGGNNDADVEGNYALLDAKIQACIAYLPEKWESYKTDK